MSKVTEYLRGHVLGEVSVRAEDTGAAAHDNGVLAQQPEMVVYPRTTNDIRKILRFGWQLAQKGHVMPFSVRGTGQDVTGAGLSKGVVIDTARSMTRIYEYDSKQRLVRLQPGVTNAALNEALTLQGAAVMSLLPFPQATVGGSIANYTAGPFAGKYGSITPAVDKLEVVLSNGDVIQTERLSKKELNRKKGLQTLEGELYRGIDALIEDNAELIGTISPQDSSGYAGIRLVKDKNGSFDLTSLFIGSQGTLGVISEMIVKSEFRSLHIEAAAIVLEDAGKAYNMVDELEKLQPLYVEYYDARLFEAAVKAGRQYAFYEPGSTAQAVLLVGFDDFSEHHRAKALKHVQKVAKKYQAPVTLFTDTKALDAEIARDVARYAAASDQVGAESPDVFGRFYVPKLQFDAFYKGLTELEGKLHIALPLSGWVLTGSYAVHPALLLGKTADKQKLFKLMDELSKLVHAHGGTFVTDGGEGKLKAKFTEQLRDPDLTKLYQDVKNVCDPQGILAPGVKVGVDLRTVVGLLK